MKIFFYLIILAFYSQACFSNWTLKREYGDISIYTSKNSTRLTLNYKTTPFKKKKFTKELLKKVKKTKEKMLSMINVTKWKIDQTSLDIVKDITIIKLTGSYVDSNSDVVYFVEYHFYSNTKKLQMLLTNNEINKLKNDATLKKLEILRRKYGI